MSVSVHPGRLGSVDWHDGVAVTWLGRLTYNTTFGETSAGPLVLIAVWAAGPARRSISASYAGRPGQLVHESWVAGHGLLLFQVEGPPFGEQETIVQADDPAGTGLIFGVFALLGVRPVSPLGEPVAAQAAPNSQTTIDLPSASAEDVVLVLAGSAGVMAASDNRLVRLDDGAHDRAGNRVILGVVNGADVAAGPLILSAGTQPLLAAAVTVSASSQ